MNVNSLFTRISIQDGIMQVMKYGIFIGVMS
jgi:hypothetical protein